MKIVIWSTAPWCATGYGKNCKYLLQALKGHDVSIMATYGLTGGMIQVNGVNVIPSNNNFWDMGHWIKYWEGRLSPDLIIQHFDLWVVEPSFIEKWKIKTPIISYMPVDSWPLPAQTKSSAQGVKDNIAMSKFAQKAFLENGLPSSTYIPHTIGDNIFYQSSKEQAKKELGIDPDHFVIGIVGTNKGPRKNIPGQLLAFKKFHSMNPQARLYLHTYMTGGSRNPEGIDIFGLIEDLGLSGLAYFTSQDDYLAGLPDDHMRVLYTAMDILSECSLGEGFGIPIIEAQACGTPVVGTNGSAITEVIGRGGLLAPVAGKISWQRLGVYHDIPSTDEIVSCYEQIYNDPIPFQTAALENAQRFTFARWKTDWNNYLEEKKWFGNQ